MQKKKNRCIPNPKKKYIYHAKFAIIISFLFLFLNILPQDVNITKNSTAVSIYSELNWSSPDNYTEFQGLNIIEPNGDISLRYGKFIYVTDYNNNRIVQTMMDGSHWSTYGMRGSSQGNFKYPVGIEFDNETDFLYIADSNNYRVIKTKFDGTGWASLGVKGTSKCQLDFPNDVYYDDESKYLYIADTQNNRIIQTMLNGSGWTALGGWGGGNGEFNNPSGIYYDNSSNYIFVADQWNHRIIRTKIDGSGWFAMGTYGNGSNQFNTPIDIYFDNSTGFLYITDSGNCRIVKTKINGSGWRTYGYLGSQVGQFQYPTGITYDNDTGYVYVADTNNNRIVKTKMNGEGWITFGRSGTSTNRFRYPHGIALGDMGYCSHGELTSQKINLKAPAEILSINWTAIIPLNTSIRIQVRTAVNSTNLDSKSFYGPGGSTEKYYNNPGEPIWLGHSGHRWIQYKVYFGTTDPDNTPILKKMKITYNKLPGSPTLVSPDDGFCTNNHMIPFVWQHNDLDSASQIGFLWQLDDDINFQSIDYESAEIVSNNGTYIPTTPIPDGVWYWRLKTQDSDGGWGPYSKPKMVVIDTKPPTTLIKIPKNNGSYDKLTRIVGSSKDMEPGTAVSRVELTIKRLVDNKYWDGVNWQKSIYWLPAKGKEDWYYDSSHVNWTSDLKYQITCRAWDKVTNFKILTEGNIFIYDTDPPTSNIILPKDDSGYNKLDYISGTANDLNGSGVKHVEISIKQINNSRYWNGQEWVKNETWLLTLGTNNWKYDSFLVSWQQHTKYLITSKVTDNLGQTEASLKGNRFIFDLGRPTSIIEFPKDNAFINNADNIHGYAVDNNGSGIERVDLSIMRNTDNKFWNGVTWVPEEKWMFTHGHGSESWNFDGSRVFWTSNIYYTISFQALDLAGNIEEPIKRNTFMFDNIPPIQSFSINDYIKYTNSTSIGLTLEASDDGSGVLDISFSSDYITWTSWQPFESNIKFNLELSDGEKVIYYRVRDKAGNIAAPVVKNIILDRSAPMLSVDVDNGNEFTNSRDILLNIQASDYLSGLNDMSYSFDGKTWSFWEQFNNEKGIMLPVGEGTKLVYVQVRDRAGNVARSMGSITMDTIPPKILEVSANNDAKETKQLIVSLRVKATDDESGVDQMQFCTHDDPIWSTWEPYSDVKILKLSKGYGEKIIYVRVKDKAGNLGFPKATKIHLKDPNDEEMNIFRLYASYAETWYLIFGVTFSIIIFSSYSWLRNKRKQEESNFELKKNESTTRKPEKTNIIDTEIQDSLPIESDTTMIVRHRVDYPKLPPLETQIGEVIEQATEITLNYQDLELPPLAKEVESEKLAEDEHQPGGRKRAPMAIPVPGQMPYNV